MVKIYTERSIEHQLEIIEHLSNKYIVKNGNKFYGDVVCRVFKH